MDSTFNIAVHALVYLNHKKCIVSSEALAKNICTNAARVRKVMSKLKMAGYIETKEGHVGGYMFCANPDSLTLAQVAHALKFRFVDTPWRSGDMYMDCLVASGMADIMSNLYLQLDETCRDKLTQVTITDIDKKIFG